MLPSANVSIEAIKTVVGMLDGNRPPIGADIPLEVANLIRRIDYLAQTEDLVRLTGSTTLLFVQGGR